MIRCGRGISRACPGWPSVTKTGDISNVTRRRVAPPLTAAAGLPVVAVNPAQFRGERTNVGRRHLSNSPTSTGKSAMRSGLAVTLRRRPRLRGFRDVSSSWNFGYAPAGRHSRSG